MGAEQSTETNRAKSSDYQAILDAILQNNNLKEAKEIMLDNFSEDNNIDYLSIYNSINEKLQNESNEEMKMYLTNSAITVYMHWVYDGVVRKGREFVNINDIINNFDSFDIYQKETYKNAVKLRDYYRSPRSIKRDEDRDYIIDNLERIKESLNILDYKEEKLWKIITQTKHNYEKRIKLLKDYLLEYTTNEYDNVNYYALYAKLREWATNEQNNEFKNHLFKASYIVELHSIYDEMIQDGKPANSRTIQKITNSNKEKLEAYKSVNIYDYINYVKSSEYENLNKEKIIEGFNDIRITLNIPQVAGMMWQRGGFFMSCA